MNLDDIFKDYITENKQFECKARLDRTNVIGWLKTVDGFCNNKGGALFLGVEDKTNKLIGFDKAEIDKEKLYFFHTLKDHFEILPDTDIEVIPYEVNSKIRYILKINVLESSIKPIILMYQGIPCVFKRRDGYTSAVTTEELIQLSLENKAVKYDTHGTNVPFDLKDFTKLSDFYYEHTGHELTDKILSSIGFFDENRLLCKGALLFKDDYDGTDTSIVCSIYEGLTRGDDKILASNRFKGNMIDSLNYIYGFIIQHMNQGFIKNETGRVNLDAYPRRSVFEAVINALAHRDYFIKGSDIFVDLFKNRLVISSPGSIFKNVDLKTTYHLDKLISSRRNELISSVFVLCNVMEAKGTGFEKILDDYKEADENHKPFIRNDYNQFSITLPDLTFADGVSVEEDNIFLLKDIVKGSKYDIKILAYCYSDYKNVREITTYLNISNSTFFRKQVLENLVSQNILLMKENGKEKQYMTNHEVVDRR